MDMGVMMVAIVRQYIRYSSSEGDDFVRFFLLLSKIF